jgi:hypothetical protein
MAKKKSTKRPANSLADIGFVSIDTPVSREDAERLWGWRRKVKDSTSRTKPSK